MHLHIIKEVYLALHDKYVSICDVYFNISIKSLALKTNCKSTSDDLAGVGNKLGILISPNLYTSVGN